MVLLISALAKIGVTKPIFLDSGSPRGEGGVRACVGMVCYHSIVHILKSRKNSVVFASTSNLCRAILPNYLRTYSCEAKQWPKCTQNLGFECMHLIGQTNTKNSHSILYVFFL